MRYPQCALAPRACHASHCTGHSRYPVLPSFQPPARSFSARTASWNGPDPYNPSDAALLREYGGHARVADAAWRNSASWTPTSPSHAALLRQLGWRYPALGLGVVCVARSRAPDAVSASSHDDVCHRSAVPTTWSASSRARVPMRPVRAAAGRRAVPRPPSSMATLRKPESNDGVWIRYGQQKWISAGRPVPFEESAFQRIGESGAFPVFRRTRGSGRSDLRARRARAWSCRIG